jgi:hypothetical protein
VSPDAAAGEGAGRRLHRQLEPATLEVLANGVEGRMLQTPRSHRISYLDEHSTWLFEIRPALDGTTLTERRLVPPKGTAWVSKTIVQHVLGGEDMFDDEMLDGMKTTLAKIKAAVEAG